MGFKPSPYNTAQSYGWAEEVIRGNPADQSLPTHWKHVEMNLPGSGGYNPMRPWVSKQRGDGHMAADILAYCDDLRVCGFCQKATQASTRRVAQMSNYLGMQDAPRNRCASLVPGPEPWLSRWMMQGSLPLFRRKSGTRPGPYWMVCGMDWKTGVVAFCTRMC